MFSPVIAPSMKSPPRAHSVSPPAAAHDASINPSFILMPLAKEPMPEDTAPDKNPLPKLSPLSALVTPLANPCAPARSNSCPKLPVAPNMLPMPYDAAEESKLIPAAFQTLSPVAAAIIMLLAMLKAAKINTASSIPNNCPLGSVYFSGLFMQYE